MAANDNRQNTRSSTVSPKSNTRNVRPTVPTSSNKNNNAQNPSTNNNPFGSFFGEGSRSNSNNPDITTKSPNSNVNQPPSRNNFGSFFEGNNNPTNRQQNLQSTPDSGFNSFFGNPTTSKPSSKIQPTTSSTGFNSFFGNRFGDNRNNKNNPTARPTIVNTQTTLSSNIGSFNFGNRFRNNNNSPLTDKPQNNIQSKGNNDDFGSRFGNKFKNDETKQNNPPNTQTTSSTNFGSFNFGNSLTINNNNSPSINRPKNNSQITINSNFGSVFNNRLGNNQSQSTGSSQNTNFGSFFDNGFSSTDENSANRPSNLNSSLNNIFRNSGNTFGSTNIGGLDNSDTSVSSNNVNIGSSGSFGSIFGNGFQSNANISFTRNNSINPNQFNSFLGNSFRPNSTSNKNIGSSFGSFFENNIIGNSNTQSNKTINTPINLSNNLGSFFDNGVSSINKIRNNSRNETLLFGNFQPNNFNSNNINQNNSLFGGFGRNRFLVKNANPSILNFTQNNELIITQTPHTNSTTHENLLFENKKNVNHNSSPSNSNNPFDNIVLKTIKVSPLHKMTFEDDAQVLLKDESSSNTLPLKSSKMIVANPDFKNIIHDESIKQVSSSQSPSTNTLQINQLNQNFSDTDNVTTLESLYLTNTSMNNLNLYKDLTTEISVEVNNVDPLTENKSELSTTLSSNTTNDNMTPTESSHDSILSNFHTSTQIPTEISKSVFADREYMDSTLPSTENPSTFDSTTLITQNQSPIEFTTLSPQNEIAITDINTETQNSLISEIPDIKEEVIATNEPFDIYEEIESMMNDENVLNFNSAEFEEIEREMDNFNETYYFNNTGIREHYKAFMSDDFKGYKKPDFDLYPNQILKKQLNFTLSKAHLNKDAENINIITERWNQRPVLLDRMIDIRDLNSKKSMNETHNKFY